MSMNRVLKHSFQALLAVMSISAAASAADWPQFMGPNGDGTSAEKGLLRAWPAGGPKVLWTVKLGRGYGAAAARDGKVYVLDRVDQKQDVLRCLDLNNGQEQWTFAYDAPGAIDHDGSRSTPSITAKHAFIIGPFGQIHCVDLATHQSVWKKHLLNDFAGRRPNWAVAQSPLVYKNLLIVAPQSKSVGMVALEQDTGKEVWKSGPIGTMAYGSPMLVNIAGVDQFVIVNVEGAASVSAADGQVLWKFPHRCMIPVPNVTSLGDGKLFVTGGYRAGSAIIQIARDGEKWSVRQLANVPQIGGHCHPGLLFQNHIFVLCNTNERADGLVCFDMSGNLVWQTKRAPYLCKGGSLLTGDGLIYLMDGEKGELYIIEPSAAGFKPLGKTRLLEGREIWAPLALADGKLLVRDQGQMKCIEMKP